MNTEFNVKFEIDKTTLRILVILAALVALIIVGSRSVGAQEIADTIRINTRVVFMDALVKDKRKLEVSSRRGYYMADTGKKDAKEATAAKAQ